MSELTLSIVAGKIRALYSDDLAPLMEGAANVETRRAAHVEPEGKEWTVDLGPSGGPVFRHFWTRQEALDVEVDWLKKNRDL